MNLDRFKNYDAQVRDLVLQFEQMRSNQSSGYFDVEQMEIIADYYLEVADVEGLESAVNYGERLFPANFEMQLRRSHLLSIKGYNQQALRLLQELERTQPNNTDVSYALGAIYSMLNQPRKAITYYQKASSDGYELGMIFGNMADEYYKLGRLDDSLRYYKKSISVNSDEERSLYNLASTWDEMGKHDECRTYFEDFVSSHPYNKNAWFCLGCTYTWLKDYPKAIDAFEYVLVIDKAHYPAYLGLFDCYRFQGDISHAASALREALDFSDDRAYVFYSLGTLYLDAGNPHTAMVYLQDAIKEDPSYSRAWYEMARCSEAMDCSEEAISYYRRAMELEPDVDESWLSLSDLLIRLNRFDEAVSVLEDGRAGIENSFFFDSRLIYCYQRMGLRNKLFEMVRTCQSKYPDLITGILETYPDLASDTELVNLLSDNSL